MPPVQAQSQSSQVGLANENARAKRTDIRVGDTVQRAGTVTGYKEPCDGFTLSAALRYLPMRSFPLYLTNLDPIRTVQVCGFRQRLHPVPFDVAIPIAATETLLYQQRVPQGTILYGLQFVALDGEPTDYFFNILNPCTGNKLFSSPVRGSWGVPGNGAPAGFRTGLRPVLLDAPIQLVREGILQVEITNTLTTNSRCQLVLVCAEPCDAVLQAAGSY